MPTLTVYLDAGNETSLTEDLFAWIVTGDNPSLTGHS